MGNNVTPHLANDGAVDELLARLGELGTPERAVNERAYLKSDLQFIGVTVWAIRRATLAFLGEHPELDRESILALVQEMWTRPVHELHMAAIDILDAKSALLEARDLDIVEAMLRTSHTWAYVDSLAADVAGTIVVRFPESASTLDRWADDPDFWLRRSALLALLKPLRSGGGDLERFLGYADAMLEEKEFFIRKAIGWVLREVGKNRPAEVRAFLEPRLGRASGLTIREAVKHLPEADREALWAGRPRR